jgi:hypothetical protein
MGVNAAHVPRGNKSARFDLPFGAIGASPAMVLWPRSCDAGGGRCPRCAAPVCGLRSGVRASRAALRRVRARAPRAGAGVVRGSGGGSDLVGGPVRGDGAEPDRRPQVRLAAGARGRCRLDDRRACACRDPRRHARPRPTGASAPAAARLRLGGGDRHGARTAHGASARALSRPHPGPASGRTPPGGAPRRSPDDPRGVAGSDSGGAGRRRDDDGCHPRRVRRGPARRRRDTGRRRHARRVEACPRTTSFVGSGLWGSGFDGVAGPIAPHPSTGFLRLA